MNNIISTPAPRQGAIALAKEKLQGRFRPWLESTGIPSNHLTGKHTSCPICGGKDRFRFDDQNGTGSWFCNNCGAGDGLSLAMRYLKISYSRLLKGIEHDACMFRTFKASNIQPVSKSSCPELRDRYERQFAQALSCVPGDEVYTYLQTTRQLQLRVVPDSIKLCRNMPYYDLDENNELYVAGSYPVLLTALRGVDGLIVALGRLYLSGDGTKAPVLKPKKLTRAVAPGACSGASVQLFPVGKTLIVTEGLETALACHVATGYPAWACWSAPGLAAFEPPKEVETLLICGDNDSNKVGQRAAAKLADRMHAQGVRTKILIPSKPDTDWLDALLKNGGIEA